MTSNTIKEIYKTPDGKYTIEVNFPKDRKSLERKYCELLADAVADQLTKEELKYLIDKLEEQ